METEEVGELMFRTKAFQTTVWLLLIAMIIWLVNQVAFVFRPVVILITTIFLPVLLAGILFYLTDPIVTQLEKWRIPRLAGIIIIFVLIGGILIGSILGLIPVLEVQLSSLARNIPSFLRQLDAYSVEFQESTFFSRFEQFEFFRRWSNIDFIAVVDGILDSITQNFFGLIGSIANLAIALFTVPFLLFYMLRDGHKFPVAVARFVPARYKEDVTTIVGKIHLTLSSYIQGVMVVCLFVGVFMFIGLKIIGVEYALLLAAVAMFTDIIPYFGPIIGSIPALVVGLIASPFTGLKVLILIIIVQQLESQLLSPIIYGKKLQIHPVTIIVILLTSGSLAGLVGIILAVPTYAVAKVFVTHMYGLWRTSSN